MKSLSRLASIAALVVGSSIALLTGAQAETLDFGPGNNPGTYMLFGSSPGPGGGRALDANWPAQSGPASFGSLSGGTFTTSPFTFSGVAAFLGPPLGFPFGGSIENFTVSFPAPCTTCAADNLTGTVNITGPIPSFPPSTQPIIGSLTITAISGDPTFVSNFGGEGGTANLIWTMVLGGGNPGTITTSTGSITPVGAPSA